jgi:hypothetical protein
MIFIELQEMSQDVFDCISNLLTEEIDDIASQRKPKVITLYKSSRFLIFDVEYFSATKGRSSFSIPEPLSVIIISAIHHSEISTVTSLAHASIEFSISSLITETGLSTTSQAAI